MIQKSDMSDCLPIPVNCEPKTEKIARLLSELQIATSITEERQRGYWIDIHSDVLRKLLGSGYRNVIDQAVSDGFLEVNERYSVNRFTKSYRLHSRYRIPQIRLYRTKRKSGRNLIRLKENDATGRLLASWFQAAEITTKASGWPGYSVEAIRRKRWFVIRCHYGRLHSSFTALPKKIRQTMLLSGQHVAELDIANCQALIVAKLVEDQNQNNTNKHQTNTLTICRTLLDLQNYKSLTQQGKIYDHLLGLFSGVKLFDLLPPAHRHKHGKDRALTRSDIKKQFILMLFADVSTMKRLFIWREFECQFPTVAAFLERYKQDHGYQAVARDCQRMESRIMIDTVAAELAGVIPLVTIHDSIICRKSDIERVGEALRSGFKKNGIAAVTVKHG